MTRSFRLAELTREKVRELAPHSTVIVATSSTEQHGPHLPINTDAAIVEAITGRAAERAARQISVLVAPPLHFGFSPQHLFACALSLTSTTFYQVIWDIGSSLASAGFRRIFLLNSHGGNDECDRLLTKDLVIRHDVAVAACSYWTIAESALKQIGARDLGVIPGHAGGFETALMMAIAPELIDYDLLPATSPDPGPISSRGVFPGLSIQKHDEWKRVGGYSDAPTKATAEKGKLILATIADVVADAVIAFHRSVA